jgi:SAM-dependent methyltransferase
VSGRANAVNRLLREPRALRDTLAGRSGRVFSRLPGLQQVRWRLKSRQRVFTNIYDGQSWGSAESGSGTGSDLRATGNIRDELPKLLERLGARTLLDAPCGDWNWMQHIELPVEKYFGLDIVQHVVEENQRRFGDASHQFTVADLTSDTLPTADAILCRDCLVHVSFEDAEQILRNFRRSGATWLLVNTYPTVLHNHNQLTGLRWRKLNLQLPPYNFPEPTELISDGGDVDPSWLGVWRLSDVPGKLGRR